jgi:hypothetical protein
MNARDAYEATLRAVGADPRNRILECVFDEVNFGNFIVSFEQGGLHRSIVNDRGELVLCCDLEGSRDCRSVVRSLREVDEQRVIRALNQASASH